MNTYWQSKLSRQQLQFRANMIQKIRQYFTKHDILEVDTPMLSRYATTDPAIESFSVNISNFPTEKRYLHSSPEFPMKRLLASGSGCIYQICKVFRDAEQGTYHNPEFTLVEWYRVGIDHFQLMSEVKTLIEILFAESRLIQQTETISYQELFLRSIKIDPIEADIADLKAICETHQIHLSQYEKVTDKDIWLDLLMSHVIQPQMQVGAMLFVYDYPASQASLAQLNADGNTAQRFEVFISGIEIANGFHELSDANEQYLRFKQEQQLRQQNAQASKPMDEFLLAALQNGLPDCSGVALGLDRLLMLISKANHIKQVIPFSWDNA